MEPIETYCRRAEERGLDCAKIIDPESIAVAGWVRMKCQFGCPGYGKRLCCPPYTPSPDETREIIQSYQKAVLLNRRLARREMAKSFNETVVALEREFFLEGYYKAWGLGSGPCRLCKECDVTRPCKHGYEARPSMEACGIDVFKTARDNGLLIDVVGNREDSSYAYGVILVE